MTRRIINLSAGPESNVHCNRTTNVELLLRPSTISAIDQLLPRPPRLYQATMITNAAPGVSEMAARSINAGAVNETIEPLGLVFPPETFSLSHVALPFPVTDPLLYGSQPENPAQYGINPGDMAVRGERSVLIVDLDTLLRVSSNPFFSYMLQRIFLRIRLKSSLSAACRRKH